MHLVVSMAKMFESYILCAEAAGVAHTAAGDHGTGDGRGQEMRGCRIFIAATLTCNICDFVPTRVQVILPVRA